MDVEQGALEFAKNLSKKTGSNDFCFGFESRFFRYKANKIKLLSFCLPELVGFKGFEPEEKHKFYVFNVKSSKAADKLVEVPTEKVASKSGFSHYMAKVVPFGGFEGSTKDYQFFLAQEVEKYFSNQTTPCTSLPSTQTDLTLLS